MRPAPTTKSAKEPGARPDRAPRRYGASAAASRSATAFVAGARVSPAHETASRAAAARGAGIARASRADAACAAVRAVADAIDVAIAA